MTAPHPHLRLPDRPTGPAVFETIELRDGHPFAPTRHLARLRRGTEVLGLACPPWPELREAVALVATGWGPAPGRLRVTVGAGVGLLVAAGPMTVRTAPTAVRTAPFPILRDRQLAATKTSADAALVAAAALPVEAHGGQPGEVLLGNDAGDLCEGATSNVVVGIGDELWTPPISSGCLPGVTRELLIEALERAGEPLRIEDLPMARLGGATEMFLLSTGRHLQPVASIDGRPLPRCPGPLTERARRVWEQAYAGVGDP